MPHARLWTDADWWFAFDTAALKAMFVAKGSASLAAEIRNRERVLGTTADYRRALRIKYVQAVAGPQLSEVTYIDGYRDL